MHGGAGDDRLVYRAGKGNDNVHIQGGAGNDTAVIDLHGLKNYPVLGADGQVLKQCGQGGAVIHVDGVENVVYR